MYSIFFTVNLTIRYLIILALSSTMTPIFLITRNRLQGVSRLDGVVAEIVVKINNRIAGLSKSFLNTWLRFNMFKLVLPVKKAFSKASTLNINMFVRVLEKKIAVGKIRLTLNINMFKVFITHNVEALLTYIVKSARVLEDIAVEKIRVEVVKAIKQLHHLFEYSLATISLILGLLILLSLIVYMLILP